ncbi:MAG: hypothetical protein IPN29_08725 [Saprospiraceae bacterium]|nr:hypothetical protein [Saprospiraceae bacterium]
MKRWSYLLIFMLSAYLLGAQMEWEVAEMREGKFNVGATSAGIKLYIAGGSSYASPKGDLIIHDDVEVFDLVTREWVYYKLSKPRTQINAVSLGRYVVFAGGYTQPAALRIPSDVLDIFDTLSKKWFVSKLSEPKFNMASAVHGNDVYFAGGFNEMGLTDRVEILDVSTQKIKVELLSSPTAGLAALVSGDSIYFAGGIQWPEKDESFARKTIDIYNARTGTWSKDSLTLPRAYIAGVNTGSKLIFAGGVSGYSNISRIDYYDKSIKQWRIDSLTYPNAFTSPSVAMHCGNAYFIGGDCPNISNYLVGILCDNPTIYIYNENTGIWGRDTLPYGLKGHCVLNVGENLVIAGGLSRYWGPVIVHKEILIKSCSPTSVIYVSADEENPQVFPNPFTDEIQVSMPDFIHQSVIDYKLVDINGIIRKRGFVMESTSVIDVRDLAPGYYILEMRGEGYRRSVSLVKELW